MSKGDQSMRRREFLRSAACAGGAMAAPWLVPASALGRGSGKKPPSERIGVAIVGLGTIAGCTQMPTPEEAAQGLRLAEPQSEGSGHLQVFGTHPDAQVVALCDVNRHRLKVSEKLAEQVIGQKGFCCTTDFRELLEDPRVDAMVVATPDHWHAPITVAACQHGKDVYCEKGLALTIADGRAIVDAVERYDRVFQYGSQSRSIPELWAVCKLVREGALGEVSEVTVEMGAPPRPCNFPPMSAPEHIDWEMWLGPAPWRPYHPVLAHAHWRGYSDFGGGILDVSGHTTDVLSCSLGLDRTGPVEVTAPRNLEHGRGQLARYANGLEVRRLWGWGRSCDRYVPAHIARMFQWPVHHVRGTRGEAWFSMLSSNWHVEPEPLRKKFETRMAREVAQAPSSSHQGNFIESILARRQPITDAEAAHRSITLAHLLCIAQWTGRTIRWDPDNEQIVGDDEAARFLGAPKREPWRV